MIERAPTARVLLGLERVSQPQQEGLGRREPVACFQRSGNLEGVSHRDGDHGVDLQIYQNREPHRQQSRDPRVFHDEQRRCTVLIAN